MRPRYSGWPLLCGVPIAVLAIVVGACRPGATATPAATTAPPGATSAATEAPGVLAAPLSPEALRKAVPALADRDARFAQALVSNQPILLLAGDLDDKQQRAQQVAVSSPKFQYFARDQQ